MITKEQAPWLTSAEISSGGNDQNPTPSSEAIIQGPKDSGGDFHCPYPGCGETMAYKRSLNRHYTKHIVINEECGFCRESFTCLREFALHIDGRCDMKKKRTTTQTPFQEGEKRTVERKDECCKLATEQLNSRLDTEDDSNSVDAEKAHSFTGSNNEWCKLSNEQPSSWQDTEDKDSPGTAGKNSVRALWKCFEALHIRIQNIEEIVDEHTRKSPIASISPQKTASILESCVARLEQKLGQMYSYEEAPVASKEICRCPADSCNRSFPRKNHLHDHIRKSPGLGHKLLRPIIDETRCLQCNRRFRRPQDLVSHENTDHKDGYMSRIRTFVRCFRRTPTSTFEPLVSANSSENAIQHVAPAAPKIWAQSSLTSGEGDQGSNNAVSSITRSPEAHQEQQPLLKRRRTALHTSPSTVHTAHSEHGYQADAANVTRVTSTSDDFQDVESTTGVIHNPYVEATFATHVPKSAFLSVSSMGQWNREPLVENRNDQGSETDHLLGDIYKLQFDDLQQINNVEIAGQILLTDPYGQLSGAFVTIPISPKLRAHFAQRPRFM